MWVLRSLLAASLLYDQQQLQPTPSLLTTTHYCVLS